MAATEDQNFRKNAHAVIIGIDRYLDPQIHDLQFAKADAKGIYKVLTDPQLGRFSPDNVILLLDEKATQRNIRSAIGTQIPRRASEQDVVYIYYAGHGAPIINPNSRSQDGMEKYLVPADAELDDLRATGISMEEILKFFGWIESKQVIFFIDSCYSGAAGGRTFQHPRYQGRHLLTGEFLDDLAGEGRLIVTACDVNEVSLETPEFGHGLFTHYLIDGLKGIADKDRDGLVTMNELYEYVHEKVSQHARSLGGSMHPVQKGAIQGKIFLTRSLTTASQQTNQSTESASLNSSVDRDADIDKVMTKIKGKTSHSSKRNNKQNVKTNPIESIDDLKKHFFKSFSFWLSKRSLGFKVSLGISLVLVLFSLARLNVFGEPPSRLAKIAFPFKIPIIDPEKPVIPLSLNFEVEGSFGPRQGKLGQAYYTGDRVQLSIRAGLRCWLTVFGVDAKGIHGIFNKSLDPSLVEPDEPYTEAFELDETIGAEIYYAIAATEKFSFAEDIKSYLSAIFPEGHSKGPVFSKDELKLPSRFAQRHIYFNHLSRNK